MAFHLICFLACVGAVVTAIAQEGHPLTGTWAGDWGPTPTQRNHVTFVMNWDGKNVTGTINPGPDAIPIASVFVDWTNWTVRIEADTKDQAGNPVHIAAEGAWKISARTIGRSRVPGAQGAAKGDFRITRD